MSGFAGHTERDFVELMAAGVAPESTQPRERPVGCFVCQRQTWHQMGRCDDHYVRPGAVDRALGASVSRHPAGVGS